MGSQAGWHTGGSGLGSPAGPMDQQTVESLLRRLVERVEESERRYGEALEELHSRLDQLSQTTDAARAVSAPEDAATLGRLHDHVSTLARRLEQEATTPLDDFERIGKALSAGMDVPQAPGADPFQKPDDPFKALDPFKRLEEPRGTEPSLQSAPGLASAPTFDFPLPETTYSVAPVAPASASLEEEDRALDRRLVDIAHQLEHSIGTAIPATAIEALNARLEEIGKDLAGALNQTAKRESLEHVERQLAEMSQQIGRAEVQLAKMGSIESQLLKLIERVDVGAPELEELATKAASEALRRAAVETNPDAARVEAIERDLVVMSEKTKASDERIANTLSAVHDSIKHLVQKVEHGAGTLPPRPRLPFADRQGRPVGAPLPPHAQLGVPPQGQPAEGEAPKAPLPPVPAAPAPNAQGALPGNGVPRTVAPAAAPGMQGAEETEPAAPFGRAKPGSLREEAVDLDKAPAPRPRRMPAVDADYEVPDDLIAAARRAAQAAAAKAANRASGGRLRRSPRAALPGSLEADTQPAKKRPILMIAAAVLLVLSALLLYGRLKSKPEPEVTAPPAVEQTAPAPADQSQDKPETGGQSEAAPETGEGTAPAAEEPQEAPAVEKSGSWDPEIMPEEPAENALGEAQGAPGTTEIAKSPRRAEAAELTPAPELVSLQPNEAAALPPGVVFSIHEPQGSASNPAAAPVPAGLLLPAGTVGPVALREAAASGDPAAQYVVALRYLKSDNAAEAVRWLERSASAGLPPAQYRLGAMYERGQGVAKDFGRARSWYQSAAEKGNVKAMHNLAVTASARDDGSADYALAAKWYGEAASYGLADSQFNLGILAEHGLGQERNAVAAYKWFSLAAKAGDKEATKRLALIKAKLDAASLAAAEEAVESWHAKSANPDANEVAAKAEWGDPVASSSGPQKENVALVSRAQALLNKLGYDAGSPDGMMGKRTRAAIRSFERKSGLAETGEVTIPLVTQLERITG